MYLSFCFRVLLEKHEYDPSLRSALRRSVDLKMRLPYLCLRYANVCESKRLAQSCSQSLRSMFAKVILVSDVLTETRSRKKRVLDNDKKTFDNVLEVARDTDVSEITN